MLINPTQMLKQARARGRAIPAFNIHNMETVQAAASAAARVGSPLILQATPPTVNFAGPDFLVSMAKTAASRWLIPVAMHLDHATDIAIIEECLNAGFTSVMYDGSSLPLEENTAHTKEIADMAASYGAALEAELGRVGGKEDNVEALENVLTDPAEARTFAIRTGVDSLAVAIGTAHGLYQGEPKLDFERLEKISRQVAIPLVLHGGTGVPQDSVRRAISLGIAKVNIATELRITFTRELMDRLGAMAAMNPGKYDPRDYLSAARAAMEALALERANMCWNTNGNERRP